MVDSVPRPKTLRLYQLRVQGIGRYDPDEFHYVWALDDRDAFQIAHAQIGLSKAALARYEEVAFPSSDRNPGPELRAKYVSVDDAATIVSTSTKTIKKMIDDGRLTKLTLSREPKGHYRIDVSELKAAMRVVDGPESDVDVGVARILESLDED